MNIRHSFDRLANSGFDAESKQAFLDEIGNSLLASGAEKMEHEVEKTPEEMEIIELMNRVSNEILEQYGIPPFDIPLDNIHVFDLPLQTDEQDIGGIALENHQKILVRRSNQKLEFADWILHEILHFKSHSALKVRTGSDGQEVLDYGYRSGLSARQKDTKVLFFDMIDEALTEELTKHAIEKLKNDPNSIFFEEAITTRRIQEEKKDTPGSAGELFGGSDVLFAHYLNPEDEAHHKGFTVRGRSYAYPKERRILYRLVSGIVERNPHRFSDKQTVLDMFIQAKLDGKYLQLARLLESTFGKGTIRALGIASSSGDDKGRAFALDQFEDFADKL